MNILKVNYINGEARFIVEGYPKSTFCVKLENQTTVKEITDELKAMVQKKIDAATNPQEIYQDLNIKNLEGTDI